MKQQQQQQQQKKRTAPASPQRAQWGHGPSAAPRAGTSHRHAHKTMRGGAGADSSFGSVGSASRLDTSYNLRANTTHRSTASSSTLALASLVTSSVKALQASSGLTITGYTGLMLPPCEDAGLAARASERTYGIHDLVRCQVSIPGSLGDSLSYTCSVAANPEVLVSRPATTAHVFCRLWSWPRYCTNRRLG